MVEIAVRLPSLVEHSPPVGRGITQMDISPSIKIDATRLVLFAAFAGAVGVGAVPRRRARTVWHGASKGRLAAGCEGNVYTLGS